MTSKDEVVIASQDADKIPPVDVDNTSSYDDVKTDKEGSLTDAEINLLNKLEDMSEEERIEKLSTMDKTGRSNSADKMRAILSIEKPQNIPNVDEEAVASYLAQQGLDKETIEEFKKTKQDRERSTIADKWKQDTGVEVDLKSESFLKNYYNQEIASLPVNLRTEVALTRTYGIKKDTSEGEDKASKMTAPSKGQAKEPTDWNNLKASQKINYFKGKTLSEL